MSTKKLNSWRLVFFSDFHFLKDVPQYNSGAYRNIERVFRPVLRDFDTSVAQVDHVLLDAFYFVPENYGEFIVWRREKVGELDAVFHLFHREDFITGRAQFGHGLFCFFKIFPLNGFFGIERCFMDFAVGRRGGNATQVDFFDEQRIGCAKNRTDVVATPDVIENNHQWNFFSLKIFTGRKPVEFTVSEFSHVNE